MIKNSKYNYITMQYIFLIVFDVLVCMLLYKLSHIKIVLPPSRKDCSYSFQNLSDKKCSFGSY
jgi:hypothetical protein